MQVERNKPKNVKNSPLMGDTDLDRHGSQPSMSPALSTI